MTEISLNQLDSIVEQMNKRFGLDGVTKSVMAVFEGESHDNLIGWSVIEYDKEGEYEIYTIEELFEKYDKQ